MGFDVILVNALAVATVIWVVWFFWISDKPQAVAAVAAGGTQEILVRVRGGYNPSLIVVSPDRPVRLHFNRQETASCSEVVTFPDFDISHRLPTDETVTIDLDRVEPGEYEFACQMGMLRGKLLVTDAAEPEAPRA